MPIKIKKGNESKLEILKSIIDQHPFGFTLMEIYTKFKDMHHIGSRNTLRKYLEVLLKRGDIEAKTIGTYRIFRANQITMQQIFKTYPHFELFSLQFLSALTTVLNGEMSEKGKLLGQEMARTFPLLESKVIQQFKKVRDFLKIIPFKQFIEKLSEKTQMEMHSEIEDAGKSFTVTIEENEATLIFNNTKPLQAHAWILYYITAGMIEFNLNDIFNQNVKVDVDKIDTTECIIKIRKEPSHS
ncbi:MAG: hypothetical protein LUQ65_15085 [Candidatus Helarchaeota archaeon]|nr:hypothetical protein [Candidatus Helarchaeota archaeon]